MGNKERPVGEKTQKEFAPINLTSLDNFMSFVLFLMMFLNRMYTFLKKDPWKNIVLNLL